MIIFMITIIGGSRDINLFIKIFRKYRNIVCNNNSNYCGNNNYKYYWDLNNCFFMITIIGELKNTNFSFKIFWENTIIICDNNSDNFSDNIYDHD